MKNMIISVLVTLLGWIGMHGSSRWRLLGECQINCEIGEMLESAMWRNLKFQR